MCTEVSRRWNSRSADLLSIYCIYDECAVMMLANRFMEATYIPTYLKPKGLGWMKKTVAYPKLFQQLPTQIRKRLFRSIKCRRQAIRKSQRNSEKMDKIRRCHGAVGCSANRQVFTGSVVQIADGFSVRYIRLPHPVRASFAVPGRRQ